MPDWDRKRLKIRSMLDLSAPADALLAYYVFYHDPERTGLYVHEDAAGHADGVVAVCQTGQRLFQPTVVLRTPKEKVALDLMRRALTNTRPYYMITTLDLRDVVAQVVRVEQFQVNRIHCVDLSRLKSAINVLVVPEEGLEGRPRFVIRSQGEIAAEAGTTWMSPHFAALYVRTTPAARSRGWDQAVLVTCTRWSIQSGRQPLYIVDEKDRSALALAAEVGYINTGAREFAAEGVCCLEV
jgi:hypothetical protein